MEKKDLGAFTVVNKNDTDGDAIPDNIDFQGVRATDGKGSDEMDLMQIHVKKPTGFGANDTAIIRVTHGAGRLFLTSLREGDGAPAVLVGFTDVEFRDFWVEVYDTSNVARDIWIEMEYKGVSDKVKATGVWADFDSKTGFHANGEKRPGLAADEKNYRILFERWSKNNLFELGKPPMLEYDKHPLTDAVGPWVVLANAMEIEFTARPLGIELEPGGKIKFDVSRTIEVRSWQQAANGELKEDPGARVDFPLFREKANDDVGQSDEDNLPHKTTGQIYSLDAPSDIFKVTPEHGKSLGYVRFVDRMNAQEFVRVKLDGSKFHDPSGNGVKGSRSSELVDWRSWADFTWDGKAMTWVRTPDTPQYVYNEMIWVPEGKGKGLLP